MANGPSNTRGLIVCGHGSRRDEWNQRFLSLVSEIREEPQIQTAFTAGVNVAFLENAMPSLTEAAENLLAMGARRIRVLPVFLSASAHLSEDLPIAIANLETQGFDVECVASPALPEILGANALRRAKESGISPGGCGVVLVYYGSERYHAQWDGLISEVGECLAHAGYAHWDSAPVGHVVQSRCEPTRDAISRVLTQWPKAIVIPLLMSVSAYQSETIPTAINGLTPEEQRRVHYTPTSILPDAGLTKWLVASALKGKEENTAEE